MYALQSGTAIYSGFQEKKEKTHQDKRFILTE